MLNVRRRQRFNDVCLVCGVSYALLLVLWFLSSCSFQEKLPRRRLVLQTRVEVFFIVVFFWPLHHCLFTFCPPTVGVCLCQWWCSRRLTVFFLISCCTRGFLKVPYFYSVVCSFLSPTRWCRPIRREEETLPLASDWLTVWWLIQ